MKKIDTHQHLLYPDKFGYLWTADFPALHGAFTLEEYQKRAEGCDIEGTLFMEVDVDSCDIELEAQHFSDLSADPNSKILGIVASCRPELDDFDAQIDTLRSPALKGIRRVLHTQPDALSRSSEFRQNIAKLGSMGLTSDLCVTQQQLGLGLELVQSCPDTQFILDHCGCPNIAEHSSADSESFQHWKSGIQSLGEMENLICKFSGITAYASAEQRTKVGLAPYLNELLESFGSERLVWGGDWPVCDLADGLAKWSALTDKLVEDLSADEQAGILYNNAKKFYSL